MPIRHSPSAILVLALFNLTAPAAVYYVDLTNTNPIPPYSDWTTAATNIQDAVDYATSGDSVLVAAGNYRFGGHQVAGSSIPNRVAVTNAVSVRSVNGSGATTITATLVSLSPPVRCAYLADGAILMGFTLHGGSTDIAAPASDTRGGGVLCASTGAVVSNCVLSGNITASDGGGAYGGTLIGCTLTNNNATTNGGGAASCTLSNCVITANSTYTGVGGGAINCTLNNCTIIGNQSTGAYRCTLNNCAVLTNSNSGAAHCTLNNCTVVGNSSSFTAGAGTYSSTQNNCIVYYNSGTAPADSSGGVLNYCCTTPQPTNGLGNFTNAPLFISTKNLRLSANSPCINAGKNSLAPGLTDLDGNPRISGGTVDVGAYEFQNPASIVSYAWLQQYRFATDGSADFADPDADGMNNWQEWICGTNPTNAQSVLRMTTATTDVSGITVVWQSVTNRTYSLERTADLTAPQPFAPIASGIPGVPTATSFTDTNAQPPGPSFYRIRVEPP